MKPLEVVRDSEIREFVLQHVQKKARLPRDADLAKFDYIEAGFVDSIGIIKFVLEIEAEFGIEIGEADLMSDGFRTVDGLVAMIVGKRG